MLKIHFLNVGHGDCTLLEFESGQVTLVDINNSRVVDEETRKELVSISESYDIYKAMGYQGNELIEKSVADFVTPVDPVDYIKNMNHIDTIFRFILTHPDMDHMSGLYKLRNDGLNILNFWDTDNNKEVKESEVHSRFDYRDWQVYQEIRETEESPKV